MIRGMVDVGGYLRRLRIADPGSPSADGLSALHRAHAAYVNYETLDIQLGRPTTIDPADSVARIVAGRGGYCFHLNGAFSALLAELGYDVTRHWGGVFSSEDRGANGSHLALTVRVDGSEWLVDVGLGDALSEPLPLRAGSYRQGPFTYRMEPVAGGWRFWHAPAARSFRGMVFESAVSPIERFAEMHAELSTSSSSGFVRVAQVGRRTPDGVDFLRSRTLRSIDGDGMRERLLASRDEWFDVVENRFAMPLPDVDGAARDRLWRDVWAAHLAWSAG
jgi:N-hydroxyarylamine O-acetyltransferase